MLPSLNSSLTVSFFRLGLGVGLGLLAALPAHAAVGISVDPGSNRAAISPYVYGSNQDIAGVSLTLRRQGGNRMTWSVLVCLGDRK